MSFVPAAAVELAKRFEGFHKVGPDGLARAYICPAGYWTVGYGRRCAADHAPITQAQAESYLVQDLGVALKGALRHCPVLMSEPELRLAAIVDLCFNLGVGRLQTSTLRREVNAKNWSAAAREMRRWVYGGGRMLPGLKARREVAARWLESPS